jgi:alkylation response protein AidB-like acyl-CoA dehydrogenase
METTFSAADVAKHNTEESCWIIIDGKVYDVTKFLKFHPGGVSAIVRYAGKDVTQDFHMVHSEGTLEKYSKFLIGSLAGEGKSINKKSKARSSDVFGELVPFGDPSWYQGFSSPYYNDTHRRYRAALRAMVEKEIVPNVANWDKANKIPDDVMSKFAPFLPSTVGVPWTSEFAGDQVPGDIKASQFDMFHELIFTDEVCRAGSGGALWGLFCGLTIGLPPLLHFGSAALKARIIPDLFKGTKKICLAISEPWAGSDVSNLRTTATKSSDGSHYIVRGEKKWITNGVFADYFTVAVRTGGAGMDGVSVLLMDKTMPGLEAKQMKCSGFLGSGTAYVTFHDVKVPIGNLIGEENKGFKVIMYNFNHERWWFVVQTIRFARVCLEQAFKFAAKRKTFGKVLAEHPVIRAKLAEMARQVEATQAWLELVTYQLMTTPRADAQSLAGPIALLKVQASKTFEFCAREAMQVMGGTGYTHGGLGGRVEQLYREVRAVAIAGGSEEIMQELGIKQTTKYLQSRL